MALNKEKTVYVGMSGGVDSSVSAALLKKAGYQVVGVFIKPWDPTEDKTLDWQIPCNWRAERREAMRAAAVLDIPLLTFDASEAYKKQVVDYLVAEYRVGRTPNPDVMCNKQIKFGVFYDWAIKQGADFVATGHYCQIKGLDFELVTSADQEKDQTYFLWNLRQDQLAHILFPVGGYKKNEVRKLAKKFGLPNAAKKDSQGLCFIGQIDFKDFLSRQIKTETGPVLNDRGEKIGQHPGAVFFTIGERHGFILDKKTPTEKPYFVIAKNIAQNTITVSAEPTKSAATNRDIKISNLNWTGKKPEINKIYDVRFRYRQPRQKGELISLADKSALFRLVEPQLIPPGQSLVFYDKEICIGGGIIE